MMKRFWSMSMDHQVEAAKQLIPNATMVMALKEG
jgi:hypothetical protein